MFSSWNNSFNQQTFNPSYLGLQNSNYSSNDDYNKQNSTTAFDFIPTSMERQPRQQRQLHDNEQYRQQDKSYEQEQHDNEQYQFHNAYQGQQNDQDYDNQFNNNKCNDSFLDIVDQHLSQINGQKENIFIKDKENQSNINISQSETITVSKSEISHSLLENQSISDSILITNLNPSKTVIKLKNSPFQFKLKNAKNKFVKKDLVEIQIQPFQSIEIQFQIKKRLNQIGNIYQTLTIQISSTLEGGQTRRQLQKSIRKYVKFQICFVKPKLEVNFIGKTKVKRIQEHKIAQLSIYPNQMNQYFIDLVFSQEQFTSMMSSTRKIDKIQCVIQTKGYLSVHPSSVILYQNEPVRLTLRSVSQMMSGKGKTSALIIKPLNSSLSYVIGVKCMEISADNQRKTNSHKL